MGESNRETPGQEKEISRRELLKMASPLGKVTLQENACTGCGLCTLECPTGALKFSMIEETDNYQMLFRHSLCVVCGLCIEACPEKCLALERTIDTEDLNGPATVLISDEIVRCTGCGSPLGSRAMINSVKSKVTAAGGPLADFGLCPDCKVKSHFFGVAGK